ncbi:MAG: DnaJ domain-containing protein [Phycisphaerales bacterium]|nr:DnaJ domain-containing protein [Phycisphaerales bacterium]MCI0631838.1 DnaJ domain-containing protein [Phycisphaerales bacterium]
MAKQRDYYQVLGVDRGATADQIRAAYRKLARKFHPDVNKEPDANKRFSEIQEAYDVLSDPEKRAGYDRFGHAGVGVGGAGGAGTGAGQGWGGFGGFRGGRTAGGRTVWSNVEPGDFDAGDIGSIFEQMFGGSMGGGRTGSPFEGVRGGARGAAGARPRAEPQRGQDIEHSITVSFMTAALGGKEELRIGGADGASRISVKVPPGIDSGAKLRIKGRGQPSPNGGPPGDLILTIEVGKHPYFRREGLDVLIDVPITIAEAVLGTSVSAPLLARSAGSGGMGGMVKLKVPPGASSGLKLRVPSKGIRSADGKTGDFFAVIQIVAPKAQELSESGRKAVSELAKELQNPRESAPYGEP